MNTAMDYLRICEEAARIGGAVIQDWIGRFEIHKKGPTDLVTQADLASQEAISAKLLAMFPDHSVLGEEGPRADVSRPRTEFRWIVDPIDGTTNYAHSVPQYAISLALERNGDLLAGTVYAPALDECFTAAKGAGAWLNGKPIRVSSVPDISEALAAVGFPYDVNQTSPDLRLFLEMTPQCQAIRRMGSSALNLCYIAAGRYDVFWSYSTKVWDVAAGVLILREAGGVVTSPTGGEFVLDSGHFLAAANPALLAQLREIAARAVG